MKINHLTYLSGCIIIGVGMGFVHSIPQLTTACIIFGVSLMIDSRSPKV